MDVSSEKKSGKNKLLQGLWKVREFHFEFGEIYIFEKSLEKVKFQVNVNLFIVLAFLMMKDGDTFLFDID